MFDPARLVFIDETCTNTSMVRLHGRCPRGERLIGYAPHGYWKTITFVAGLRHRANGRAVRDRGRHEWTDVSRLCAAMPCSYAQARRYRGDGQSSSPQGHWRRGGIEAAGARLRYLPPYSPDLNPIELAFSKVKAHLRKAAEQTIPRLVRRIGRIVADFPARECRNFFRHAGYVQT